MAEPSPRRAPSAEPAEPSPEDRALYEELRHLLIAPEKRDIAELRERIENPEVRAEDVSAVLAEAIEMGREQGRGAALSSALAPTVEEAVRDSVQRDPQPLADALFPVMGPAIRKSIAEAIRSMLETFNQALEHSVSVQGLRWRFESFRTGRPFAEVVLLHSLLYRVEQVLLIHRATGLKLEHCFAPTVAYQDPAMVSGMLTAIQDFVRDSFQAPAGETLDSMRVGELEVWVEQGPQATIAAVIRGHAPTSLRTTLQTTLEKLHGDMGPQFEGFDGDCVPFERARPDLSLCLESQYKEKAPTPPRPYFWVLLSLLAAVLLLWWGAGYWNARKWSGFVETLRKEPGLVVTSFGKEGGKYQLRGLRDPLAANPAALLEQAGLDAGEMRMDWASYYALDDALVQKRAESLLAPPAGAGFSVREGVLRVTGAAPAEWLRDLRTRAILIPGVRAVDFSGMQESLKATLEKRAVLFPVGRSEIPDGERKALAEVAEEVRAILEAGPSTGTTIEVVGHTDPSGAETANRELSRKRAEAVVRGLVSQGVSAQTLRARGAGTAEPLQTGNTEEARRANRSVTFRVLPAAS